jgi:hypothetical protein
LRREPVAAWPGRVGRWFAPPYRQETREGVPPWPFGVARPEVPPPEPQVPGDLRASWNPDRGQRAAFAALRGERPVPFPTAAPANAHEAAFRLVSAALAGVGDVRGLASFVAAHRSRGTSARNHAVAERAALALAAVLGLRAHLPAALELPALLAGEVDADGAGVEQSAGYLLQDLEWGLLAWRCGVPDLEGPLARGAGWLADHLDADGRLPDLGDDDDGTVFPATTSHRERVGAVLQALRAAVPAGYVPGFVAGLLSLPDVVGVRAPAPRTGRSTTALRRGPHLVVLDHGPFGASPLFGHAHADALAVWGAPDGRWVVGGRGTHQYTADPHDRRFRRGASAVATVVVDGRDPAEPHDAPFLWRSTVDAERVAVDLAAATVTGRSRTAVGTHTRTVTLAADGTLRLDDHLEGAGRHHVAVSFPLRPGAVVDLSCDERLTVGVRADVHSPRYGVLVPATTITASAVLQFPATLSCVLRPRRSAGT